MTFGQKNTALYHSELYRIPIDNMLRNTRDFTGSRCCTDDAHGLEKPSALEIAIDTDVITVGVGIDDRCQLQVVLLTIL